MIHPRRIAWNTDGTKLFIASNSNNKKILSARPDDAARSRKSPTSRSPDITPIGIAFDADARRRLDRRRLRGQRGRSAS